ncbi:hypothetical protein Mahau_2757 [Mahella australiensis 50-1 BON]|uniref:Uncharacterized protein n=1 Tax=Mahella australiensis (strain DSM 15567 / CIP 107919 / 50-1 BON) TaxID=697281 RepID=F3ZZA8_MAHA5|nr:hypothetical protein Mahau_2757 [Mahella australiensis 50-1 BON]
MKYNASIAFVINIIKAATLWEIADSLSNPVWRNKSVL